MLLFLIFKEIQLSFKIKSDPLSAITMVGAFVLPEVMLGIIEASITLKLLIPKVNKSNSNEDQPSF